MEVKKREGVRERVRRERRDEGSREKCEKREEGREGTVPVRHKV